MELATSYRRRCSGLVPYFIDCEKVLIQFPRLASHLLLLFPDLSIGSWLLQPSRFYDAPSDQVIWDPNGGKNDGVLAVCVRVAYKVETELISYFDTKIYLDVNFEAEFDLNLEDADLKELEEDTNTTTNINLVSFDDDGTMITTMMNDDRNESEYKV